MKTLSAEYIADQYWFRMRRAAIKEVETKLAQLKTATPATMKYWLEVHSCLEKKAARADERRALIERKNAQ